MTGNIEKIQKAFREGNLFVHMFERHSLSEDAFDEPRPDARTMRGGTSNSIPTIFNMLSGDTNVFYRTEEHKIGGSRAGFIGLPTTALKEGVPVRLFAMFSQVGVIFDGNDHRHVHPLMVGSSDMYSRTKDNVLSFRPNEVAPKLAEIQGLSADVERHFPIEKDVLRKMVKNARTALPELWKYIDEMGWNQYKSSQLVSKGLNEVSLVAHIKGVRGLVVNEREYEWTPDAVSQRKYCNALMDAKQLRDFLLKRYADEFPDGIPIMSYDFSRTQQPLKEVTEEQLREAHHQSGRISHEWVR